MAEDLHYVPWAVPPSVESAVLRELYRGTAWSNLRHRRVAQFGGSVDPRGTVPAPIPQWLEDVAACLASSPNLTPLLPLPSWSHVLVNEYVCPGGIMAHEDGPMYEPVVAIFSFLSSVPLVFVCKKEATASSGPSMDDTAPSLVERPRPTLSSTTHPLGDRCLRGSQTVVIAQPRSAVVFRGQWYTDHLHTVPDAVAAADCSADWARFGCAVRRSTSAPYDHGAAGGIGLPSSGGKQEEDFSDVYDDDDGAGGVTSAPNERTALPELPEIVGFGSFVHWHAVTNADAIPAGAIADSFDVLRQRLYDDPFVRIAVSGAGRDMAEEEIDASRVMLLRVVCRDCGCAAVWIPRGQKRLSLTFRRARLRSTVST